MGFVFNSCASDDLLVQQRCGWAGAKTRLRREDCEFVKHDKLFSKWKILVGPSDSTEHISAGKDGIGKYHVHNLPATHFGPGVYELGVTAPSWSSAPNHQRTRTLKREDVIAVYVGQAANIRQRLQKYGQAVPDSRSSKLYQGSDNDSVGSRSPRIVQSGGGEAKPAGSGPRLFSEVFALGSSIAFRWAHTDSKVVAEQVELELLAVFDYAWNKGISGNRRSRDILAMLFMAWPTKDKSFYNLMFSGKRSPWLLCGTNAVGIKVALRKPQDSTPSTNSNKSMMARNLCFLMTVQPQVPAKVPSQELRCGVVTGKGMPCNAPPLRGRKRCLQHYEIERLRGVIPAAGSINPSHPTTKQINVDSVKLQAEPVTVKSSLPKGFLGRDCFFPTKTRTRCKEAVPKEDKPVETRRPCSLSFNTWVKGETDQRVHDSQDINESTYAGISVHKPAIKQERVQSASGMSVTSPKRRVLQVGSKYVSVPDDDSKRR